MQEKNQQTIAANNNIGASSVQQRKVDTIFLRISFL